MYKSQGRPDAHCLLIQSVSGLSWLFGHFCIKPLYVPATYEFNTEVSWYFRYEMSFTGERSSCPATLQHQPKIWSTFQGTPVVASHSEYLYSLRRVGCRRPAIELHLSSCQGLDYDPHPHGPPHSPGWLEPASSTGHDCTLNDVSCCNKIKQYGPLNIYSYSGHVCSAMNKISLLIGTVWSKTSLDAGPCI